MKYWTIKEDGKLYPRRFICKDDEMAQYNKDTYKLEDGEEFVLVTITEV